MTKHYIQDFVKAFSFTEVGPMDKSLMWHHYASNHRGICLEYDTDVIAKHQFKKNVPESVGEKFLPQFDMLHPVSYQQNEFGFNEQGAFDTLISKTILIKDPHWAYENEWRLVLNSKFLKSGYIDYIPPSKIYLVSSLSEHSYSFVNSLLKNVKDWIPLGFPQIELIKL